MGTAPLRRSLRCATQRHWQPSVLEQEQKICRNDYHVSDPPLTRTRALARTAVGHTRPAPQYIRGWWGDNTLISRPHVIPQVGVVCRRMFPFMLPAPSALAADAAVPCPGVPYFSLRVFTLRLGVVGHLLPPSTNYVRGFSTQFLWCHDPCIAWLRIVCMHQRCDSLTGTPPSCTLPSPVP